MLAEAQPNAAAKAALTEEAIGLETRCLPCAVTSAAGATPALSPAPYRETIPQLRHRVKLKTVLLDLLSLFNRIVPPYPRIATGLYRVGNPDRESPVLVTGNYELTARRLVRELDGRVD